MKSHTAFVFQRVKHAIFSHEGLLWLLALQLFLRLPNLFEPYWYGDEGIYLTLGNALRSGERLYTDIIDHKTPLIYYLAMVPGQCWFRFLLVVWTFFSTIAFYELTVLFRWGARRRIFSTLLFILLTTLPLLEGNIPNGELFVIGFVLVGAVAMLKTNFVKSWIQEKVYKPINHQKDLLLIFISGFFFSLGILTKVPSILDALAFGLILSWICLTVPHFTMEKKIRYLFYKCGSFVAGLLVPILFSFFYYWMTGSLTEYINIGFLYNLHYTGNWQVAQLPFSFEVLSQMKVKLFIAAVIMGTIAAKRKLIRPQVQLLIVWTLCALVAATLSSRPYPHYLLQVVPPLTLLLASVLKTKKMYEYGLAGVTIGYAVILIAIIRFGVYSVVGYYSNFFSLLTMQINKQEYDRRFDSLMADNYAAAPLLMSDPSPEMFIWGTNPTLYALTRKNPVGRFTVAFHIADFPGGYAETQQALEASPPKYIVVMKNETLPFPEFFSLLHLQYAPLMEYQHFWIFQKI
jgi:hypothetical protein